MHAGDQHSAIDATVAASRRLRFLAGRLLFALAFLAIAVFCLRYPTGWSIRVAGTLTIGAFLFATTLAVARLPRQSPFACGFALCGWLFLIYSGQDEPISAKGGWGSSYRSLVALDLADISYSRVAVPTEPWNDWENETAARLRYIRIWSLFSSLVVGLLCGSAARTLSTAFNDRAVRVAALQPRNGDD
jgi:hypothetical protein